MPSKGSPTLGKRNFYKPANASGRPERHFLSFLLPYVQIARPDHWIKNVFVLPGIVVAFSLDHSRFGSWSPVRVAWGFLAVSLITSSNYIINELLDAPFDRKHPSKQSRPVASGLIDVKLAYIEWIALMVAGIAASLQVSVFFTLTMIALWIMGCIYNIPPIRSKDLPYLDVLSESVNNPLRLLAGWFMILTQEIAPLSLLISYWMIGCYFMAIKRYAEYRDLNDASLSAMYRKSFAFYDEQKLLVSIMFYGSNAMLLFGAFLMRYRLELILAFPAVALVMAVYLSLAFKPNSAAQRPEGLYREPALMTSVVCCAFLMIILMFWDLPWVYNAFPRLIQ
jgi:4-hydroxybenzoate polyprenyltransferase